MMLKNSSSMTSQSIVIRNIRVLWETRKNVLSRFLSWSYNFFAKYLFPVVTRELGLLVQTRWDESSLVCLVFWLQPETLIKIQKATTSGQNATAGLVRKVKTWRTVRKAVKSWGPGDGRPPFMNCWKKRAINSAFFMQPKYPSGMDAK